MKDVIIKANEIYNTTWFGNSTANDFGSIYNNLKQIKRWLV